MSESGDRMNNGLSSRESTPQPLTIVEEENCATASTSDWLAAASETVAEQNLIGCKSGPSLSHTIPTNIQSEQDVKPNVQNMTQENDSILDRLAPQDTDKLNSVSSSSCSSRNSSPESKKRRSFDWVAYLEDTGAQAAPNKSFFQPETLPPNLFIDGQKIETIDPRSPDQLCLATVISKYKVWIQVRLDGCDDSNDFWALCDDTDLHPVGYGPSKGRNLVPPVGSQKSIDRWLLFLDKQINEGERASKSLFQPIDENFRPKKNRFKVGEKLEAIDTNPGQFVGKVSPATIVHVKGNEIVLKFDGWSKAYNKTVRFDSRNVFPVGWASKNGVDILKPPKMPVKLGNVKGKEILEPSTQVSSHRKKVKSSTKQSRAKKRESNGLSEETRHKRKKSTPTRLLQSSDYVNDPETHPHFKIMPPPNQSFRDSATPPTIARPSSAGARARKSTSVSGAAIGFNPEKREPSRIMCSSMESVISPHPIGKHANELSLVVYFKPSCACGIDLNPNLLANYSPTVFGPANLNQVMRMCVQLLLDCALHPHILLTKIEAGSSKLCVTADVDGRTLIVKSLPIFQHLSEVKNYLSNLLQRLATCQGIFSFKDEMCYCCEGGKELINKRSPSVTSENSLHSRMSSSTDREGPQHTKCAETWTKEEVVQYLFSETKDKTIADSFAQADMDGKALLMLTPELMIKHMEIRLGPALKLHGIISKLKGMPLK